MKIKRFTITKFLLSLFIYFIFINCNSHISDLVFDDTQIYGFYLTFYEENFWEILVFNDENDNDQYVMATFEFNGEVYENVGVRFKGNKSMSYPSNKKPFKIKFNEFIEDQEFYGLTKLSLSNEYSDPSFLREKIFCDLVNQYIPSPRANFVKLYINGDYWGVYTNVEQINKRFIKKNFGNNEDGNLFKGDPYGDLVWYGAEPESYYDKYELKTNQDENDWSDLVNLIDVLNNTDIESYPFELEQVFHIRNYLFFHVINNFLVNMDSYFLGCHNYYVYHREDTDKFVHIPWDFNYSFATLGGGMTENEIYDFPLFYMAPPQSPKPLVNRTFEIDHYRQIYLMNYKYLIETALNEELLFERIDTLSDLIRDAVYADTLKMYTNEEFEINLEDNIETENGILYGLKNLITQRIVKINEQLNGVEIPEQISNLHINEFLADNESILKDEYGEYEDWIEIYNDNDFPVNMNDLFLSDDPSIPDKWKLPEIEIPANGYLLFWADAEIEQGSLHTNFKLNSDAEFIGLYGVNGVLSIDSLSYGSQETDISYGSLPDGGVEWQQFIIPSPLSSNMMELSESLFINEFMAKNESTIYDDNGEYDDWIEIYNKNNFACNLNGLSLTDDPAVPGKWQFPEVNIPANGYLLVWADNDEEQGELHTNFKLCSEGEFILLYDIDGTTLLDSIVFGEQQPDISYGRIEDGYEDWQFFNEPSPGQSNNETICSDNELPDHDQARLIGNYPNPFRGSTTISFHLTTEIPENTQINIYNCKGQKVKTLECNIDDITASSHSITWDGNDVNNRKVSSGVYFYKLRSKSYSSTKKMILVR